MNDQRSSLQSGTDLRLMAHLTLMSAYSGEGIRAVAVNMPTL
jgi:hypothetical protein